ncbi:surface-associated interspersed protein (SURFIN), partial [Plasmodium gallinaceum]
MDTEKEPLIRKRRHISGPLASGTLQRGLLKDWRKRFSNGVDFRISKIKNEKSPKMKRRLCRHLNYWVDERRDYFTTTLRKQLLLLGDINKHWADTHNSVVEKLKASFNDSCKRIENKNKKDVRDKKKVMEDFCEDKEERLQELNENVTEEKCIEYSNWLNENKSNFEKKKWINEQMIFDENLEISENCTLNDMNTFVSSLDCSKINKKENDSCDSKTSESCNPSKRLTPGSSSDNGSDRASIETIKIKPNATTNLPTTTINSTTTTEITSNTSIESTTPTPGSTQKLTSTIVSIHSDPNLPKPAALKAIEPEISQRDVSPTTPTPSSTSKIASTTIPTPSDEDLPKVLPLIADKPMDKQVINDIIPTFRNNDISPTVSDSSESSISPIFGSMNTNISGNSQTESPPTTPTSAPNITSPSIAIQKNMPTTIQVPITNFTSSSNATLNKPSISPTSANVNATELTTMFKTSASSGNTSKPTSTIKAANISTNLSITS